MKIANISVSISYAPKGNVQKKSEFKIFEEASVAKIDGNKNNKIQNMAEYVAKVHKESKNVDCNGYVTFQMLKLSYDEALEFADHSVEYSDEELVYFPSRTGMDLCALYNKASQDPNLSETERKDIYKKIEDKYIEVMARVDLDPDLARTCVRAFHKDVAGDRYPFSKVINKLANGEIGLAEKLFENNSRKNDDNNEYYSYSNPLAEILYRGFNRETIR